MSRIESGRMTLNNEPLTLPETLENIVAIMQPMLKAKHQKFAIHLRHVRHEQLWSDPLRLRQQRLDQLQRDVALLSQQLSQTAMELAENSQKNDEAAGILRRLQNRKEVLENLARQPFNSQAGVKAVMDFQAFLPGVLGVVAKVLEPE